MVNTYDSFSDEELEIAELIQQRRLQLFVHSYIYYNLDSNVITDKKWDEWARELVKLQSDYPEISEGVRYYDAFKDWDASTGAFLPFDDWVKRKALVVSGKAVNRKPEKPKRKSNDIDKYLARKSKKK